MGCLWVRELWTPSPRQVEIWKNVYLLIIILQTLLATQSALLALFLLTRRRLQLLHHRYLAGFLVTLTLHMGSNILSNHFAFTNGIGSALGFLYGPWIYLHTRNTLRIGELSGWQHWSHAIPALAVLVGVFGTVPFPRQILAGSATASLEAYLFLAWHATRNSSHGLSKDKQPTLSWLRKLILSLILIGGLDFAHSITLANDTNWSPWLYAGVIFALWTMVNYLIYKGLQQSLLFGVIIEDSEDSAQKALPQNEEQDPSLRDSQLETLKQIETVMKSNSVVTDPDLTLDSFSKKVGLSSRKISEAINTLSGQSFSDFVNHHRINLACEMLKSPSNDHKTILEILFESGFSTKSNFYAAFKKKTGKTPVEFRKAAKKESKMAQKGPVS
jgi:AraC-like DNA-binding protein